MSPQNVTVVIPALNEAAAIAKVVHGVCAELPEADVIVVDDGSRDDTGRLAAEAGARVIAHDLPRGYGAALRSGTLAAEREYVLFCDGDGQHDPGDIRRLVDAVDGFEMVVGQRTNDSHRPVQRRPGKLILKWFANYLAGQKIPDLNSGLRIIRRETLVRYLHLMPDGFSFSTTSTFALLKTGCRIRYVRITVTPRVGKSTVRQIPHGMQTILLMLRLTVLFEPLKVFLTATAGMLALSLLSFGIDLLHNRAGISDTTVILCIATLLVFMFGLLCDQVSAIRRHGCL